MSGRRNSRLSGMALWILGAVLLVLAGGWFLFSGRMDPFRDATPLDVPAYSRSGNSLRGNSYKLEGEILMLLAWSPSGRLVSVGIENGRKAIPVLLPNELNAFNIERGQKFNFLLVVDDKGILRAKKVARI